jgi:hypothetical protein
MAVNVFDHLCGYSVFLANVATKARSLFARFKDKLTISFIMNRPRSWTQPRV